MQVFDPRSIGTPVYESLKELYDSYPQDEERGKRRLKEQKSQAVQLYTYLATWGLMRLKAEEYALNKDNLQKDSGKGAGKVDVIQAYFQCLEGLPGTPDNLSDYEIKDGGKKLKQGTRSLETIKALDAKTYLGLTGLGLSVAQEFSFWAAAIYIDIEGE